MSNKQNHFYQPRQSLYMTHQPKHKNRYPIMDKQLQPNSSILDSPIISNVRHSRFPYPVITQNNQIHEIPKLRDNDDLNLSIKQKFKLKHLSSVHQLIASARLKKSQIQDLLRNQQLKAEQNKEMQSAQIASSLRRLKKVVRLLQIVCKIIMAKNQQNSYIDLSTQNDISIRQMNSLSMQNYERQINVKNSEIFRLKKLIQILSINNSRQSILGHHFQKSQQNLENSCKKSENKCLTVKNSLNLNIQSKQSAQKLQSEIEISQIKKYCSIQVQTQLNQQLFCNKTNNLSCELKQQKLSIYQEYSLWNILDAGQNKKMEKDQFYQIKQPKIQQSQKQTIQDQILKQKQQQYCMQEAIKVNKKLSSVSVPFVRVKQKNIFLKRYKSIVKIAINAINMCNNILATNNQTTKSNQIQQQLQNISQYFNKVYHEIMDREDNSNNAKDQIKEKAINCDIFYKQTRDKVNMIYQKVHKIYSEIQLNKNRQEIYN